VLLGEQFGRRHQRGLASAADRQHRGQRGDHGLAAAYVSRVLNGVFRSG
jgi:hypothetical protein